MEWYGAVYGSYLTALSDNTGKMQFVRFSLKLRGLFFKRAKVRQA